jgi:hypothetical protein
MGTYEGRVESVGDYPCEFFTKFHCNSVDGSALTANCILYLVPDIGYYALVADVPSGVSGCTANWHMT